ncbi:hypothetical protein [Halobaculum rubrum]|uniref:hypothetical protein n=1 Tax=Halobaculum rubrum TaxID=2872158 RepID=UPI001CA3FB88|nr:hypothetical protein [Halobaculum rubrum]QZX99179.1 hypothetical protein K6T25_13075 [Halobaculum rubrum]
MDRRSFLRSLGVAGLTGIAGCTGDTDSGDGNSGGGQSRGGSTATATDDPSATSESTETATDESAQPDTAASETGYSVRIRYNGEWQGSVGTAESTRSVDGEGDRTISIEGSPDIITVNAQKQDDSTDEITVQVLKNGDVIEEASSTAAYGLAQVSANLFGGGGSDDGGGGSEESPFSVRIQYNAAWQGSISTGESSRSISGTGSRTIDIDGSPNVITVNAQKQDGSDEKLTVQILESGDVVKETSTTAGYGVAQVSYSNF